MNLNITQGNLHLLLPGKLSWMAEMYMEDQDCSVVEAIRALYKSHVYRELEIKESDLWKYGPVALYEMIQHPNQIS